MYKLYVFIRSDLESMTVGKAAAQVAHAASQHAIAYLSGHNPQQSSFNLWRDHGNELASGRLDSSHEGFGTTIVLDGGSFYPDIPEGLLKAGKMSNLFGVVRDPTYPLKDGKFVHLLDIPTCVWIFDDPDYNDYLSIWLKQFKLYNGNHD